MSKPYCLVSCPIDTYSGYGARSRDIVKALIEIKPDWDIEILSQRWGVTRFGYLDDHNETDLKSRIIKNPTKKPNIWIQITVPNEYQPVGDFNIGITALIETTAVHESWIEGCNKMDLNLVSSEHGVKVLNATSYEIKDKSTLQLQKVLKIEKPVEVLFEGFDEDKYFKDEKDTSFKLDSIKENFCFLTVGHWMHGKLGHDRKNIAYTIKVFLETFKNKSNPPALLLKTQKGNSSSVGKEKVLKDIDSIRKKVKGVLPNIYLINGDLTDAEMNSLYNHPKVKAMLSLTRGEGFGRPLLEFSATGKPIIASNWSGQTDFLQEEYNLLVGGTLEKIDQSSVVKNMLIPESSWFKPNDFEVNAALKNAFKNYKKLIPLSRKQRRHSLDNFTFDHMVSKFESILEKYSPTFPEYKEVQLPKLNLPKLKKIDK